MAPVDGSAMIKNWNMVEPHRSNVTLALSDASEDKVEADASRSTDHYVPWVG